MVSIFRNHSNVCTVPLSCSGCGELLPPRLPRPCRRPRPPRSRHPRCCPRLARPSPHPRFPPCGLRSHLPPCLCPRLRPCPRRRPRRRRRDPGGGGGVSVAEEHVRRGQEARGVAAQVEIEINTLKQFIIFSVKSLVPSAFNMGLTGSTCTALPRGRRHRRRRWRPRRPPPPPPSYSVQRIPLVMSQGIDQLQKREII